MFRSIFSNRQLRLTDRRISTNRIPQSSIPIYRSCRRLCGFDWRSGIWLHRIFVFPPQRPLGFLP